MSLLFAERPLVINTQLAMKIGLNEAGDAANLLI